MSFSYEYSSSSWRFSLWGWVQTPSQGWGHEALAAEHTLRAAHQQPGPPPAALLMLIIAPTGKFMPYHKLAIQTGLPSGSSSENPALQPGGQGTGDAGDVLQSRWAVVDAGSQGREDGSCLGYTGAGCIPTAHVPQTCPVALELRNRCWEPSSFEKPSVLLGAECFCKTGSEYAIKPVFLSRLLTVQIT